MNKKEVFFEQLQNIFTGSPINGYGGYVNLLRIKNKYYNQVINELKNEIGNDSIIDEQFEEDFYTKLYNFFIRYFNECGSIFYNKTTDNDKIYEQVYKNNEDVSLFWKTHMLYYVKSDILFNDVDIRVRLNDNDKWTNFRFDVGELKNKQNNEKLDLVFKLENIIEEKIDNNTKGNIILVKVYQKEGQYKISELENDSKKFNVDSDLIEKAIFQFKKQSSIDFFINKDAKKFLNEQLDLYMHNILLDEKSEFDEKRLLQLKTIKKYGNKLINFISQFENELVMIWNKPKFVLNSNYVISIDKLNNDVIKKIQKSKNLKLQIEEWTKLGIVDKDFELNELGIASHPHLPIDTKYFKDLELEIIGLFDNLDEELNGRLIHSENYQALNTMKNRYNNSVQCIYVDPPFNTGKDFEYLDGYQDSTWLNIMMDRVKLSYNFLKSTGGIFVHLDRYANYMGRYILNNVFDKNNYRAEIYWDTCGNTGFKSSKNNWYQNTNCILQYAKNSEEYLFNKQYKLLNVNDPLKEKEENTKFGTSWLDIEKDEEGTYIEKYINNDYCKQYITPESKVDPIGMIWTDILSFLYTQVGNNESYFFNGGQKPECLLARVIKAQTEKGNLVLDFFSGIGTTCAIAHKLNRKFIGVEMGEHFNTFYSEQGKFGILARMKNVINGDQTFYALNPTDGTLSIRKPNMSRKLNWQGGGFFKYYDLEQYEDTLNKMKYKDEDLSKFEDDIYNQYVFFSDKKLTDFIEVNDKNIDVNLDSLYENIDLPETISLALGESIKRITKDEVILEKSGAIKYNIKNMNSDEKKKFLNIIKKFIWWGE